MPGASRAVPWGRIADALVAAATRDHHSKKGKLVLGWSTNDPVLNPEGPRLLDALAKNVYSRLQRADQDLAQYLVAAGRFADLFWGGGNKALEAHNVRDRAERVEIRNTIRRIMHQDYEDANGGAPPPDGYFPLEPVPPPALPFHAGPDPRFTWLPRKYVGRFKLCGQFFLDEDKPERLGFRLDPSFPPEVFAEPNCAVYFLENPDGTFTKIGKTNKSVFINCHEYQCLLPAEPAPGKLRILDSRSGPAWLMQLEMLSAIRAQMQERTCNYYVYILPRVQVAEMEEAHSRLEAGFLEQPLVGSYVLGRGNLGLFPWGNAKERGMSWEDIEEETKQRFQLPSNAVHSA